MMEKNGAQGTENPIVEYVATPTAIEIQLDSQKAVSRIASINQVIDGAVKVSLQRTNPSDWVKMGDKLYLQASGAQKLRAVWGLYYRDRHSLRENNPDGTYSYIVTGVIGSKLLDGLYGEVTLEIEGGRSSNDPFFSKNNREPDPLDVRKAALANWEARAVTALLGLGNLSPSDLAKNGVDTSKITGVVYAKGAEGGGQTGLISEPQQKRFHAIRNQHRISEDLAKALLAEYGFDSSAKITRAKYEEICALLEKGAEAVSNRLEELRAQKAEKSADNSDASPVPFA